MTVDFIRKGSREFQRILDAVSRELITVEHNPAGDFIKTPLTYPGGSSVVIQVGEIERGFFVSDYGMGSDEAELMGANRAAFAKYAHAIAEATGVRFDNHSFFCMEASREQLAGAITIVANASQAAVIHTAFRLADKAEQTDAMLFDRLRLAFRNRKAQVLRSPKIIGYSSTPWHVDALVSTRNQQTIFEAVGKHPASIAAATTKFHDIARKENAPTRIAVVHSKRELGTYLGVLSQAATVIEDSTPDKSLVQLADAA